MNILLDMNLQPRWVGFLDAHGFAAAHWSAIGNPRAPDTQIMLWATQNGHVVFTHDLDFGALLAATQSCSPSVIQVRADDTAPEAIGRYTRRTRVLRKARCASRARGQGTTTSNSRAYCEES